ncbi:MAG: Adenylate cyclase [Gammaproteobacteria bacterium]|nr:MAG: Adenylate cyclase [Gammaproteobacteria bacterium]
MNSEIDDREHENLRVEELLSYEIMGAPAEFAFDDIVDFATEITACPVAFVHFIDSEKQWAMAAANVPRETSECQREDSICNVVIRQNDVVVIPDTLADDRFKDIGCVCDTPNIRFYMGAPLINTNGFALGTLCLVDFEPRQMDYEKVEAIKVLARQVVAHLELRKQVGLAAESRQRLKSALDTLQQEKEKSEKFLRNVLPPQIATEWLKHGDVPPRYCQDVTVGFTDFVGFTQATSTAEPGRLVATLNEFFSRFDELSSNLGLDRLKTIGDSYMFCCGVTQRQKAHAAYACLGALQFMRAVSEVNDGRRKDGLDPWAMRVGLHSGPVMAGVVGETRFSYDIWGDTVNVAARLEQASDTNRINISEATHHRVKNFFDCTPRGEIEAKNKGMLSMYWLDRIKPQYSADDNGLEPNQQLLAIFNLK